MPTYRRRTKKSAPVKKRTYRRKRTTTQYKKRKYNKPKSKNPFRNFTGSNPFKPRLNVKLTFASSHTLTCSTDYDGFGTPQTFMLNSLYDPDVTGTGHQPYLFDQLTPLYSRYKVNGCLVEAMCNDPSAESLIVGAALLNPDNLGFSLSSYNHSQVLEFPQTMSKFISNTGSQTVVFRGYIPINQALNWTKTQFRSDNDGTTAAVGSNPGTKCYLQFAVANMRSSGAPTVMLRLKLTYYATFYDRKFLSQS